MRSPRQRSATAGDSHRIVDVRSLSSERTNAPELKKIHFIIDETPESDMPDGSGNGRE
jgi:hypothetical protein